ncbi:MAG: hypothetical protein K5659_09110 [Lachnospiraceae bacterium]|nr:hypothetical protein [Lachnospiraceae bacterium]
MLYKYEDIVAVNDIHNKTVGIGFIVDVPLLEGSDEKYSVIFNSGNPIAISRRSIKKLYTLRGYAYEGFAYTMRDIIRRLGRGTYMAEQEFEKYCNAWLESREYLAPSKPRFNNYSYDPKFMDVSSIYPVKRTLKEITERITASPIKFDIDEKKKEEIKKMINETNKAVGEWRSRYYWEAALSYKKIIFNGPCTIILWADGTKTIAKLYEDIDKFDPEKGVAICFMKKILGHTETNKILRKATKQYADETTKSSNTSPTIHETLKAIADRLSEPLISFNKEDKDDSKS